MEETRTFAPGTRVRWVGGLGANCGWVGTVLADHDGRKARPETAWMPMPTIPCVFVQLDPDCLVTGGGSLERTRVALLAVAGLEDVPVVTHMQGVDCPECEDGEPHEHAEASHG